MEKVRTCLLVATVLLSLLAVSSVEAYPSGGVRAHRQKRVSDQRLAELQTMLAIMRIQSNLKNPTGKYNGFVDPALIGRKKRSQTAPNEYMVGALTGDDANEYVDGDDDGGDDAEVRRYLRRRLSATYHH